MPEVEEQALPKVVILGAGGFAREVLDVFEACNRVAPAWDVLGFVVEPGYAAAGTIVNDKPDHIMQFFAYSHLPPHLQAVSKPFCDIARLIAGAPGESARRARSFSRFKAV